ncbi:MAG: hypothetical protein COC15_02435 [Legionellales bacterium]|nr:MAG: hypothetical protein COC15_02435 [Legionellales bacterium]
MSFSIASESIASICRDLFSALPIDLFAHCVLSSKDTYSICTSNAQLTQYLRGGSAMYDKKICCATVLREHVMAVAINYEHNANKFLYGSSNVLYGKNHNKYLSSFVYRNSTGCEIFSFRFEYNNYNYFLLKYDDYLNYFISYYLQEIRNFPKVLKILEVCVAVNTLYKNCLECEIVEQYNHSIQFWQDLFTVKRFYLNCSQSNKYLTCQEMQCLKLSFLGNSSKDIANILKISEGTVSGYVRKIKIKYGNNKIMFANKINIL